MIRPETFNDFHEICTELEAGIVHELKVSGIDYNLGEIVIFVPLEWDLPMLQYPGEARPRVMRTAVTGHEGTAYGHPIYSVVGITEAMVGLRPRR